MHNNEKNERSKMIFKIRGWGLKPRVLRKITQISALLTIILIPVLETYKRLLIHLPDFAVGSLLTNLNEFSHLDPIIKGGYLSWLLIGIDRLFGLLGSSIYAIIRTLDQFKGYFWSVTFGGLTIFDPLAILQFAIHAHPFSLNFLLALFIPLLIALIFGRVFCSWICPINTLLEVLRLVHKKLKLSYLDYNLVTFSLLRYLLLGGGVVATLAGIVVFPYILPYAVLGRVFYYLTAHTVLWSGMTFILLILILDVFIQKGVWCNYLCPTGGLLNILGRKRLIRIRRNEGKCIKECHVCQATCPWNSNPKFEQITNCSSCYQCVERCPGKALKISCK